MFLILIDTHSKWIEAAETSSTSPACVIKELQSSFARFGSPEMTITDIATCFTSAEFKAFLERNGVKHVTSAPYHPSSNGVAERYSDSKEWFKGKSNRHRVVDISDHSTFNE